MGHTCALPAGRYSNSHQYESDYDCTAREFQLSDCPTVGIDTGAPLLDGPDPLLDGPHLRPPRRPLQQQPQL